MRVISGVFTKYLCLVCRKLSKRKLYYNFYSNQIDTESKHCPSAKQTEDTPKTFPKKIHQKQTEDTPKSFPKLL